MYMFNKKVAGKRIRVRRQELGLTMEKLAEICDISVSYMGLVERGHRFMSMERLIQMSRALDLPIEYILLGKANKTKVTTSQQRLIHIVETFFDEKQANLFIELYTIISKHNC